MSHIVRQFNFDDDLCELILSYLSLEDKVRFECVCKQWQQLIYNSVHHLDYPINTKLWLWYYKNTDKQLIISEKLLKKCHFLRHLTVSTIYDTNVLMLITESCKLLQTIHLRFDEFENPLEKGVLEKFGKNCGQYLTKIRIRLVNEKLFSSRDFMKYLSFYSKYFPSLNDINLTIGCDTSYDSFKQFTDQFSQQIKHLDLRLILNKSYKQKEMFEQISRYKRLISLQLVIECQEPQELELRFAAKLFAENMQRLSKLYIELREGLSTKQEIIDCLQPLTGISALSLEIRSKELLIESFEALKTFKRLTELTILYKSLNDKHFTDIHLFCPKLQSIELKTTESLSDSALYSLIKLDSIEKISIYCPPFRMTDISDSCVCAVVNSCKNIKILDLKCGINISERTFDAIRELGERLPKKRFRISLCWKRAVNKVDSKGKKDCNFADQIGSMSQNVSIRSTEFWTGWCGTGLLGEVRRYNKKFTYDGENDYMD